MRIVAPRRHREPVICHGTHRIELVDGKGECPPLNIGDITFLEAQGFRFETDEPVFTFDEPGTDPEPAKAPRRRGRDATTTTSEETA
ncbi:MAG: hypothetical protein EOO27_13455 [Comamonadaceae bacterium]|jgi:hypothetical protein|nr:MAG: hypothetical protein EOO27_13455 [Comamonadaceae bacterium]